MSDINPNELNRIKIQLFHKLGYSPSEIADKLCVHKNTVYKWRRKKNVKDDPRSGR